MVPIISSYLGFGSLDDLQPAEVCPEFRTALLEWQQEADSLHKASAARGPMSTLFGGLAVICFHQLRDTPPGRCRVMHPALLLGEYSLLGILEFLVSSVALHRRGISICKLGPQLRLAIDHFTHSSWSSSVDVSYWWDQELWNDTFAVQCRTWNRHRKRPRCDSPWANALLLPILKAVLTVLGVTCNHD